MATDEDINTGENLSEETEFKESVISKEPPVDNREEISVPDTLVVNTVPSVEKIETVDGNTELTVLNKNTNAEEELDSKENLNANNQINEGVNEFDATIIEKVVSIENLHVDKQKSVIETAQTKNIDSDEYTGMENILNTKTSDKAKTAGGSDIKEIVDANEEESAKENDDENSKESPKHKLCESEHTLKNIIAVIAKETDDRKRSSINLQEIEIKVHDLSLENKSVEGDINKLEKESTESIIEIPRTEYREKPEDFINPFRWVIKTPSLQLLDDKAEKGVIKRELPIMTMNEVVLHNKPDDCWVIIFGVVRNLTELIQEYKAKRQYHLVKPIVAHAGKDISHWFNENTNDILHFVHPITGVVVPYTPHGRVPDVGLQVPSSKWQPQIKKPWWENSKYIVGLMTKSTRPIRILNTLNRCEVLLHVCCEDSIYRILERYLPFNRHAYSYTWKYDKKVLDMKLTLDENGIGDERKLFTSIGITEHFYIPCLMLYFNDDLTEM